MQKQKRNINKEMENIKKNQKKFWSRKVQYLKLKNSLDTFQSRFEQMEKISVLEDRMIEITES